MSKLTFSDICQNAATEISRLLEQGTAPWQQPLKPGASRYAVNGHSGKPYQGLNQLWLCIAGQSDPRWVTYRQAAELGGQVRKGSKSRTIVYWRFDHRRARRDAAGKIVKDAAGATVWVTHENPQPLMRLASVFNATQVDDLPPAPWETESVSPDLLAQQADAWIAATGAQVDVAVSGVFGSYSPYADKITILPRALFESDAKWYSTLFHELAHWTSHPDRLNRTLLSARGDKEAYAREELRAEMAAWMICQVCGTGFEPGDHASYVASWLQVLKDDPAEIYRASRDASAIVQFLLPDSTSQDA